jgi:hypothetical protein
MGSETRSAEQRFEILTTLEDQSPTVARSIEEMHGAMNLSAKHLWNDMHYRELFAKAFGAWIVRGILIEGLGGGRISLVG